MSFTSSLRRDPGPHAGAGVHEEIPSIGVHLWGCMERSLAQGWTCKCAQRSLVQGCVGRKSLVAEVTAGVHRGVPGCWSAHAGLHKGVPGSGLPTQTCTGGSLVLGCSCRSARGSLWSWSPHAGVQRVISDASNEPMQSCTGRFWCQCGCAEVHEGEHGAGVPTQGCPGRSLVLGYMCRAVQGGPWCWGVLAGAHEEVPGAGSRMHEGTRMHEEISCANLRVQGCAGRSLEPRCTCRVAGIDLALCLGFSVQHHTPTKLLLRGGGLIL